MRVEQEALHPLFGHRSVELEVAVLVIAQNRMPRVREVHPDLMRAASQEPDLEQAGLGALLGDFHLGQRAHAALLHADTPLAGARYIFVQRLADVEAIAFRHAFDERYIDLLHLALAQLPMQFDQRAAFLAHDEQARGIAVQAMGELEELGLRAARAERLDHAIADAASAMYGHASRLVHNQYRCVLVNDRKLGRPGGCLGACGDPHGRNPYPVADPQAIVWAY